MDAGADGAIAMGWWACLTSGVLLVAGVVQGAEPQVSPWEAMASIVPVAPWSLYPDDQVVSDFSGAVSLSLTASAQADLPVDNDGGLERVSGSLSLEFGYTHRLGDEQTTTTASGYRTLRYDRPANGPEPGRHERVVERFSGPDEPTPLHIANLHFSPRLQRASFQMQLGTAVVGRCQVNGLTIDREERRDDQPPVRGAMSDLSWFLSLPCGGTAPTRWAELMRAGPVAALPYAGPFYYESPSRRGECRGELAVPVCFRDLGWAPAAHWRARGWDPEVAPERSDEVMFTGRLRIRWSFVTPAQPGALMIGPADPSRYERWVPSPGGLPAANGAVREEAGSSEPLLVTIRTRPIAAGQAPPRGRIDVYLRDVSGNPGSYDGDPAVVTTPDLSFVDLVPGMVIDPEDPQHAWSAAAVDTFTVALAAHDTAAYGRIEAVCNDLGLIAAEPRTGRVGLVVPRDDNRNRIADAWESASGLRDALPDDDHGGRTVLEAYRSPR